MGAGLGELIAIDGGFKDGGLFGIARYSGGRLSACAVITPERLDAWMNLDAFYRASGRVALERMRVYPPGSPHRADPDDLIRISEISGWLAGRLVREARDRLSWYRPDDWKGSLPKPVAHAHARRRLDPGEIWVLDLAERACGRGTVLDLRDAVSLGLAHLRRTPWRARSPRS